MKPSDNNWLPKAYNNATDFTTDEQLWKEAFQRYNGGSYWSWVPNDINDPNSNGRWVNGGNGYGDDAWKIYNNVNNGNPPVEW